MKHKNFKFVIVTLIYIIFLDCSPEKTESIQQLRYYPADNLNEVVNLSRVALDSIVYAEGSGSFKIEAKKSMVVKLYETGKLNIENCHIIYQAKLKTVGLQGAVYLEMWCHFPGKGDFFSRALQSKLTGDNDWSSHETSFMLQKGESPDNVKLNLAVNGTGTVWIDEIKLLKVPLE
jgi:hypothetical protein